MYTYICMYICVCIVVSVCVCSRMSSRGHGCGVFAHEVARVVMTSPGMESGLPPLLVVCCGWCYCCFG